MSWIAASRSARSSASFAAAARVRHLRRPRRLGLRGGNLRPLGGRFCGGDLVVQFEQHLAQRFADHHEDARLDEQDHGMDHHASEAGAARIDQRRREKIEAEMLHATVSVAAMMTRQSE